MRWTNPRIPGNRDACDSCARVIAAQHAEQILDDVTAAAVELIPGADVSGILLVKKGGEFESVADTTGLAAKLDKLQHDFGEGPCAQAALEETIVRSDDLCSESRWPLYAPAAVDLGVRSGLSFKLFTADRTAGALNLFAFKAGVWDADAETTGACSPPCRRGNLGQPARRAHASGSLDERPYRADFKQTWRKHGSSTIVAPPRNAKSQVNDRPSRISTARAP